MQIVHRHQDHHAQGERLRKGKDMLKKLAGLLLIAVTAFAVTASAQAESLPVSSHFGWRVHPITGAYKFHAGVDLAYDFGMAVPSLFDGTVAAAGDYGDGYGYQVLVYHDTLDCYTRYAHLSSVFVQPGEFVSSGYTVGLVGSTGVSTGPHLHLEYIVRSGDGGYEYADPLSLWQ